MIIFFNYFLNIFCYLLYIENIIFVNIKFKCFEIIYYEIILSSQRLYYILSEVSTPRGLIIALYSTLKY